MLQLVQDLRSGTVEMVEVADPVAGPGQVVVRTAWSLISPGTEQAVTSTAGKSLLGKALDRPEQVRQVVDKALKDGVSSAAAAVRARLDDLMTPGYSSCGVVEAVGRSVGGLRPGDRVACVGANAACHAERVAIPAPLCSRLPASVDSRWGAFGALGAIAAHGVRIARVDAGSVVAVIGMGLVGQLAAQLVTAAGGRAIAIDLSPERVALAERLGAAAGMATEGDVASVVMGLSGGHGADAVLLTAAASDNGPVELAASIARDRAVVSVVGDVGLAIPRESFFRKELELRVSRSYGPGRYDSGYEVEGHDYPIGYVRWTERRLIDYFLGEVAIGRVRLEELVSHEFPIERGVDAYEALSDPDRMAILLRYGEDGSAPIRRAPIRVQARSGPARPRVGVIGPGLFARATLLPRLRKLDVELVGLAGRLPARAYGVARRWDAAYAASDPAEVIADPAVDFVVIATRHDSHAELAAQAMEAGKAVFLEKPVAVNRAGVERVRPLLEAGGRFVVDFNRSYAPASLRLAAHLRDRREPIQLHYRVNAGYLEPGHWLRDPRQGGGRLVGEACHFVDLCSALVARPLAAVQVLALGEGPRTLAGDNFTLILRYEDGSLATVAYVSAGDPGMPKERLEIIGAGRGAVLDDFRRVETYGSGRRSRLPAVPQRDKGHGAMLAAALRFFRDGGEPPIPYERLLETTEATLIARRALADGDESQLAIGPPGRAGAEHHRR